MADNLDMNYEWNIIGTLYLIQICPWVGLTHGLGRVGSSKFDLFVDRVGSGPNPVGHCWVGLNFRWVGSGWV